jgi:cell wall-associated NlpC family hydrolase
VSSPGRRTFFKALPAVIAVLFTTSVLAGTAAADPVPPPNATELVKRLADAQHEAEALTEQWHAAKDALKAKQAQVEPTRKAADAARQNEEQFRQSLDPVTQSAYANGNLDQLSALLASDSPANYLDQMFALETFSADQRVTLEQALAATAEANRAAHAADDAANAAQQAADEIGKRQRAAETRIAEADKLLRQLSPSELAAYQGPPVRGPSGPIVGGGKGAAALRAALTRAGSPYMWGGSGPSSFDCSGLVLWAFQQIGVSMPRTAENQAGVGTPVSQSDLQPGDLVFFYSPITHVGFYGGEGKVFNAVDSGDVVRYSNLSDMPFNTARRI